MALEHVLADLSFEEARQHLDWLSDHAPARVSGTPDQERAAEYFVEQLEGVGLEARLDTFTAYRSLPLRGAFQVLSPEAREFPCEPCAHIVSTPDEGIEADLVYLGPGGEEQYAGSDVRGKAVLTEISAGPARPQKALIAARHGASAIVFANWGLAEFDTIPCGAIKCVWGNPTRAMIADVPQIAALGISRAAGDELIEMMHREPVRVRLVAQATRDWGPLTQPCARLLAPRNTTGDFLVVGGHHDAWEPGMTDNASGNSLKLMLARVFSEHRDALLRDIVFAFWNGHEIGDYEGSTWFVDRHWDDLDAHGIAYFNVDSVGLAHSDAYVGDSTPELMRFHQSVEESILGSTATHRHLTRDNEHPFFGIGLPALEGRFHFSQQQVDEWGGARGGWWWHSRADTFDKIDPDRFEQTARVYSAYIWGMCTASVLPMDFTIFAERIAEGVSVMQGIAGERLVLDLPVKEFSEAAGRLHEVAANRHANLNRTLMRLSRTLLPAFETAGGRHTQDRCGLEALDSPIPALHDLAALAATPTDSEHYHLIFTELMRQRNRLSDALRHATEMIEELVS